MRNPNISKVNFSSRTKEELSKINSQSGKKSEGAKKRWFREKNPEIKMLMDYYKSGDSTEVMQKYMEDNEKFMKLYADAIHPKDKSDILKNYMNFQYKTFELMVGTKSLNLNLNLNKSVESAKSMEEIYVMCKEKKKSSHKEKEENGK